MILVYIKSIETSGNGVHDAHAIITVSKASIKDGRNVIDVRGSYCWAGVGQTRVDATGMQTLLPDALVISVPNGTTMSGRYSIIPYN